MTAAAKPAKVRNRVYSRRYAKGLMWELTETAYGWCVVMRNIRGHFLGGGRIINELTARAEFEELTN